MYPLNNIPQIIHIISTTDKNYLQHCGVMLCSLFENNPNLKFNVHLIVDFEHDTELKKIKNIFTKYNQILDLIYVDGKRVANLSVSAHASKAVCYRLLLPELLDNSIDKVLYLDCDIVIKKDISHLWHTVLEEYVLAAVREPLYDSIHQQRLGLPVGAPYFNSGVMLVNLRKWKEESITEKALQYAENNPDKLLLWDQDTLNMTLLGQWLELPPKWNQTHGFFNNSSNHFGHNFLYECLNNPTIIHFSSFSKPWQYLDTHPLKKEYFFYLRMTDWKNFKHPEETYWHYTKQYVKRCVNLLYGKKKYEIY